MEITIEYGKIDQKAKKRVKFKNFKLVCKFNQCDPPKSITKTIIIK
jgi:hypothetical protein